MSSLQQAPAKGQQVPPPVLIDGVSEQQIDAAVKAHVKRTARSAQTMAPVMTRQQLAINMAIGLFGHALDSSHHFLMNETAKRHDNGILDALNLIDLGRDFVAKMRAKSYQDYDDCTADFVMIGCQIGAIARAYGDKDDAISRMLRFDTSILDVMLTMIELEGDQA